jgi:hypothetical protein
MMVFFFHNSMTGFQLCPTNKIVVQAFVKTVYQITSTLEGTYFKLRINPSIKDGHYFHKYVSLSWPP